MHELALQQGNLTGIDLSKLPRGLEGLFLQLNNISTMTVGTTPPSLKSIHLQGNPVEEKGITLHLPLTNRLQLFVPTIGSLNLNGGQKQQVLTECGVGESAWWVHWANGTQIMVLAAPEQVEFDFYTK